MILFSSTAAGLLLAATALGAGAAGSPASLVARWSLDEPPFADSQRRAEDLAPDPATGAPASTAGVVGKAARLQWDGTATRLAAYGPAVQQDSFGFSFWVRPVHLSPGESLIGKEIAATTAGPEFSRLAWQIHVGASDGGAAPLVFLVRGSERGHGDFHGSVVSTVTLPLGAESADWVHVAGGYDASSGKLVLHVNGVETAAAGVPGARSSDGGAFTVGSMVNGSAFIAYAALAEIDEVQLYDHPLATDEASRLMADPAATVASPMQHRFDGDLVAHWKLDEAGPWFGDWSGQENNLHTDGATSPASKLPGVDGEGVALSWSETPGVATRLFASGDAFQTDSFGFSFWIRPLRLAPGENFIAKEAPPAGGEAFTRLAWQVQVGQDNGSGKAPLELVVRGGDRSQGDFFGSVLSTATLPLFSEADEWIHVAGGYDASSGKLGLFVNGAGSSAQGWPGARHADGSWISLGSVRNGLDFVAYGAIAAIDDVQLYSAPLSDYEATYLRLNPGAQFTRDKQLKTTFFQRTPRGGFMIDFNSIPGWQYVVEGSLDLADFRGLSWFIADGPSTRETVSDDTMETVMGSSALAKFFARVRALLPDAEGLYQPPPAEILPFENPAPYVPQFHFSRRNGPVGDPCGILRHEGRYHLFTWDHAASDDLLHWEPLGWPLGAEPPDSSYWTGSVVVDQANTSGFGSAANPPMVAVYTIHNKVTGKETIGISYSTNHRDFIPYAGNPVIVTGDQVFRDPDVFWDTQTNRWIMTVARSTAQQIQFYGSHDLKSWFHLSDFGPVGARNEMWECPSLAQLPVKGAGHQRKWLLQVGGGTNKVQYWAGHFDGTSFTMDESTRAFLEDGSGIDGEVFSDFEHGDFWNAGWTYTGSAFGNEPAPRWWNQPARGHLGQRMASSHVDGDWHTGSTLTSSEFTIGKSCINFQIGGGNHSGRTCINLLVDGNVVRTATGDNSDVMRWAGWNVAEFMGRNARLQIVDDHGGFWGRIYIDHIVFSNILTDHRREHANWVEFGPDFFAPKFLRDFDGVESDAKWIGWLGSWEYEASRPVPLNHGKGAESIFRKLQLAPSPKGYQLVQQPDVSLRTLRGPMITALPRRIEETMPFDEFQPTTNTYELEAVFNLDEAGEDFGFHLCAGGGQRVTIGYDAAASNLYLDRRSSGHVSWHPGFPKIVSAPLKVTGGELTLRVFVDQCAVGVFTGDRKQVLTAQIYPDPAHTGIELFSHGGATTLRSLRAWPLASAGSP